MEKTVQRDLIISAISTHRDKNVKDDKTLNGLLYRADKLSRACFSCDAEKLCDWKKDKKNLTLKIWEIILQDESNEDRKQRIWYWE